MLQNCSFFPRNRDGEYLNAVCGATDRNIRTGAEVLRFSKRNLSATASSIRDNKTCIVKRKLKAVEKMSLGYGLVQALWQRLYVSLYLMGAEASLHHIVATELSRAFRCEKAETIQLNIRQIILFYGVFISFQRVLACLFLRRLWDV